LFYRQRKREEDFQRTVSNYRTMVETLRQEKKALLELQEGGEGEKSDLVSASQKALARAAQLVQDAAEMRKREAQAAIDRIESQVRMHLCERLESMLPSNVAAAEIASIKGELLLSKVVGKSSLSLDGIARSFSKTIRARAWEWRSDTGDETNIAVTDFVPITLSQEQQQMAATMIHQSEVAHVAIDVSGDLLWLLSAGQWPDILSSDASAELGAIMGHSMNDLDMVLGNVLNTLKEEGVLSPHQSNIGEFRQTVVTTMQTLRSHIEHDGESLVPMNWKPPALKLFRDASRAKYSSLGCYAAVACVLNAGESNDAASRTKELISTLKALLRKLDQASSEAAKSCLRLAHLDILDETIVSGLSEAAETWRSSSDDLLGNVYNMLLSEEGLTLESVGACEAATDEVVKTVSHFATVLRSANLTDTNDNGYHPFSPEVADVWEGVTLLAKAIRSKDGDEEDINYLVRARTIEHSLEDAVEAVPALSVANNKVASLEKSLSLRSKEIALQNARLSELEKLLAKTNAQPSSRIVSSQTVSSEEVNSLKQENRVLEEAMDVLHRQVEEYENEIRVLRDSKTPTKGVRSRAQRRAFTPDTSLRDRSRSSENLSGMDEEGHLGAFEAALFRPALLAARKDAAQWKAKATIEKLLSLPPLDVPISRNDGEEKEEEKDGNPMLELSSALAHYQDQAATVRLVDISKPRARMQLHEIKLRTAAASQKLDKAAAVARQWLENHVSGSHKSDVGGHALLGRVRFAGPDPVQTFSIPSTSEDLYRLQLHVVR
jgi:dynactin 1